MSDTLLAFAAQDPPPDSIRVVRLTLDIPAGSAGIVVRLRATWTRIVKIVNESGTGLWMEAEAPPNPRILWLDSSTLRLVAKVLDQAASTMTLVVHYIGEEPGLLGVPVATPAPGPEIFGNTATQPPSVVVEYANRGSVIAAPGTPHRASAQFFYDLDSTTYTPLLRAQGQDNLADRIDRVAAYLTERTSCRAAHCRSGLRFRDAYADALLRDDVATIENLLQPLLPRTAAGDLDAALFDDHFRLFVTGALVLGGDQATTHGQPNSENFFSFVEVALLFRLFDLRWQLWRQTLPTLVTAAQVFTQLYWNGTTRLRSSYHLRFRDPAHNGSFSADRWQALRNGLHPQANLIGAPIGDAALQRRIDQHFEDLFSDTVAHAFRDHTMFNRTGGILVGGAEASTMTLKAVFCDANAKPATPPADLAAYWATFQELVAKYPTCQDPGYDGRPEAIGAHLLSHVVKGLTPPPNHQLHTINLKRSRSSPNGWVPDNGGGYFPMIGASNTAVGYFGCDRIQ